MSRDDGTVLDLLKAARLASQFIVGIDRDDFLDDEKTQQRCSTSSCYSARVSSDFQMGSVWRIQKSLGG